MTTINTHQYSLGKSNLYLFYRFVVLPWELEWVMCKFLVNEGNFKHFCENNKIDVKSFESAEKLNEALLSEYQAKARRSNGILWFVRKDTKPKDTLRHLRNCFAHGDFRKGQKNKIPCVIMENTNKQRVRVQGHIPLNLIKGLVASAVSCKV